MTASSSLVQLAYIAEATRGVTPNTGNGKKLRMTGESLKFSLSKTTSKEINSTRQVTANIPTGASSGGGFSFELSAKEYDPFIANAMQADWVDYGTAGVSSTLQATFTANKIVFGAAPTGADDLTRLQVGQYFRVIDAAGNSLAAGNAKVCRVVARTATDITVAAGSFTVDAVAKGIKIAASRIANGTVPKTFTIERQHTDVGQFFAFRGMQVGKMSLKVDSAAILSGSFDFMGTTSAHGVTSFLPGVATNSQTGTPMNAISGVSDVQIDTAAVEDTYSTFIKSVSFDFDNKLQGLGAIGHLGSVDVMSGTINCKGTMEVYLADGALYDDFINCLTHQFSFLVRDTAGAGYAFTFPRIDFDDADTNAPAADQPCMLSLKFTAVMDPVTQKSLLIDRF